MARGIARLSRSARTSLSKHYAWQLDQHRITADAAARYIRLVREDLAALAEQPNAADRKPSQSPHLGIVEGDDGIPGDLRHGASRAFHFHVYFRRLGRNEIEVIALVPARADQPSAVRRALASTSSR